MSLNLQGVAFITGAASGMSILKTLVKKKNDININIREEVAQ